MSWLWERRKGFPVGEAEDAIVPIVPGAVIRARPVGVLLDLSADGLDPARLLAPAADPDRQAAWLALFAQLKASGARLWRCVLPVDRRADALALGVLAAQAGLSEALPTLNARPFMAPAAGVATGPRQVTLF